MSVAKDRALDVRQRFGLAGYISDDQLSYAIRRCHLTVTCHQFRGHAKEVLHGRRVWLQQALDRPEKRWLVAHALGHSLLHCGDHFRMDDLVVDRQERQAELFAGWLFLADTYDKMPPWELAEYHCLPQERIECWLGFVRGEVAISAG